MTLYLFKRLTFAMVSLFALVCITFFLLRFAPGSPFDSDKAWPPDVQAVIESQYGLHDSLPVQFYSWISQLIHGDLGESFHYSGVPVTEMILDAITPSAILGGFALIIALFSGVVLGALAAYHKGTALDLSAMFVAVAGVTLPAYLVATLLILLFSTTLGWLPPALLMNPSSYILPIITLALRPIAMIARLTRSTMVENMGMDFVRTALSKGSTKQRAIGIHVLRNSLLPVIGLIGPLTANIVTGSYVVELVFQIPGLAQHFVSSVINRDYPLVLGLTLTYGTVLVISNLFVDALYVWADPRIRIEASR
jgi:oligopeptide transport system permease protein